MQTDAYCRCFGEKLASLLTPDDIRQFSEQSEPNPSSSARSKIKWARDECVFAGPKSEGQRVTDSTARLRRRGLA
jgi:hypothetical protein